MANLHNNHMSNDGPALKPVADSFTAKVDINEELALAKRMYGRSLAQQLSLEFEACRQIGRLPGPVASSSLMTEILLGTDESIGLDYLNHPLHEEKVFDFAKSMTK